MSYLMGIDIGSTNIKVAIFKKDATIVTKYSLPNCLSFSSKGKLEYSPKEIWERIEVCIKKCMQSIDNLRVKGIAISSMGEVGFPIDKEGLPLYSAISWMDQRTVPQADWWRTNFGEEYIQSITGMPLDAMYSINQIIWLKENHPDAYYSMYKWICLADYIIYKFTGQYYIDYSLASRTMAFDVHKKEWSSDICKAANIDPIIFSKALPSGTIVGAVSKKVAEEIFLPINTPVVLGGHDHACVAIALGLDKAEDIIDSTGTGEAIIAVSNSTKLPDLIASANCYCCYPHCFPDKYLILGHLGAIGKIQHWILNLTGQEMKEFEPDPNLPIYFPYLNSARCNAKDLGILMNISPIVTNVDLLSSVMEGICMWFKRNLGIYAEGYQTNIHSICLTGGLSRYSTLTQLKSDIINIPIEVPNYTDLPLLGAAIIAGVGVGEYASWEEVYSFINLPKQKFIPNKDRSDFYNKRYKKYIEIFEIFEKNL